VSEKKTNIIRNFVVEIAPFDVFINQEKNRTKAGQAKK
jgi:hypothetical protein